MPPKGYRDRFTFGTTETPEGWKVYGVRITADAYDEERRLTKEGGVQTTYLSATFPTEAAAELHAREHLAKHYPEPKDPREMFAWPSSTRLLLRLATTSDAWERKRILARLLKPRRKDSIP